MNFSDISTSAAKDYEVTYGFEIDKFPENVAFETAATLKKDQNTLNVLLNQVPDTLEDEVVENAAMLISNLSNSSGTFCLRN